MIYLPKGWTKARLSDFCDIIQGQSPPGSTYNNEARGIPFFQGKTDFGPRNPVTRVWCDQPSKIANAGDILISIRAPVGPTNIADQTCAIGRGLAAVRPLGKIQTSFVLHAVRAHEHNLRSIATGSTFAAVSGAQLRELEIPLPPLSEQDRIVAEIEKHFTRLDSAVRTLNAVAVGRTNNVRATLLADMVMSASGNVSSLGSLLREPLTNGRSVLTAESGIESFPVLRLTCVRGGRIDTDQFKEGSWSENAARPFLIQESDFLIIRGNGSRSLVGRAGVVGEIRNAVAYPDTLIRARFNESFVHLPYIAAIWNSMFIRRQIEATARTTAGIYKINQKDLCELAIPLPDLATQKSQSSIWSKYDSVIADADVAVKHALKRAERLRQSILAKAFSGQLVPQNPTDEPASMLLERIGEQRGKIAVSATRPARRQKPTVDYTG